MIKPASLQRGDTIAIVAPARRISEEDINYASDIFRSWGLNVVLSKNIFSGKHSYFGGSDKERLDDFQTMINDPKIKAIICARGGYGSTRLIDQFNFSPLQQNCKWIVGFSDITAIHLTLFKFGYQSIHGTMPVLFSKPDSTESLESLRRILFGSGENLVAKYSAFNKMGRASGETIGGNLSLIIDALGTKSEPDLQGKILIIEEIDEYFYKIDRMINQLKRTGKVALLAGLVVGHFTSIKDTSLNFGQSVEEIILKAFTEYNFPIAFGFQTGHENPNIAWRHGGRASLVVQESGAVLTFENEVS